MNEKNIFEEYEQPIRIAEMLISASYEREANAFQKAFGCPEKYNKPIYDTDDLKEIADHLLAFCKNSEAEHGE